MQNRQISLLKAPKAEFLLQPPLPRLSQPDTENFVAKQLMQFFGLEMGIIKGDKITALPIPYDFRRSACVPSHNWFFASHGFQKHDPETLLCTGEEKQLATAIAKA